MPLLQLPDADARSLALCAGCSTFGVRDYLMVNSPLASGAAEEAIRVARSERQTSQR